MAARLLIEPADRASLEREMRHRKAREPPAEARQKNHFENLPRRNAWGQSEG